MTSKPQTLPAVTSPLSRWNTRGGVVIACAAACLLTVAITCGPESLTAVSVAITDGGVIIGWLIGATCAGGLILRAAGMRRADALSIATAAGLGLGLFSLLGLLLGLLGWLNRPVAMAFMLVPGIITLALTAKKYTGRSLSTDPIRLWLAKPAGLAWVWLVPVVSLTIAAVAATVLPGIFWKPFDPIAYDVLSYHLQVPREWYELHRIVPLPHNVFSYFPFNVEVNDLLLMHLAGGPWAAMYSCQFLSVAFTVLTVSAICAAGVSRGGIVGAAAACTAPWVVMLGSVAYIESAVMLYTALAVAWAMRAFAFPRTSVDEIGRSTGVSPVPDAARHGRDARATDERDVGELGNVQPLRSAAVAGVAAGLACGCKITCVPMLLLAVPAGMLLAGLVGKTGGRRLAALILIFGFAGTLVLSPWLIRDWFWAHNPLYPVAMSALGADGMSPAQVLRFRIAHSPTPPQQPWAARFGILWRDILIHWQYGYLILPAGLAALAAGFRNRRTLVLAGTSLVVLIVWIGFTHLLARFAVMLIPLAGIAIGQFHFRRNWEWITAVALIAGAAVPGWIMLVSQVRPVTTPGNGNASGIGLDLAFMTPPQLTDAVKAGRKIGLVGGAPAGKIKWAAPAFIIKVPTDRLHYRSVFDVTPGVADPIEAWLGPGVRGKPGWLLLINPSEINRLHDFYLDMPAVPRAWAGHGSKAFLLESEHPDRIIELKSD
jgi:hypothetical protein